MRKLSPWARIVRAGHRGTGLRLSPEDVARLMLDDAIVSVGEAELADADEKQGAGDFSPTPDPGQGPCKDMQ